MYFGEEGGFEKPGGNPTETGGVGCTTPSSRITPMTNLLLGRSAHVASHGMGTQLMSESHGFGCSWALSHSSSDATLRAMGPTPIFTDSFPSLGAMMPVVGMRPFEHFNPPSNSVSRCSSPASTCTGISECGAKKRLN